MSKFRLKSILYYIPIIVLFILSITLPSSQYSNYIYIIKPLFWLIFAIICHFTLKDKKGRYKYKKGKVKTIIIITLFYLIFWFLSGLIFNYVNNSYSTEFFKYLRNIWSFILILVFREYSRMKLIQSDKSTTNIIILTLLFSITEINYSSVMSNLETKELAFKYTSGILFPIIVKNILLTYLSFVGGWACALSFVVPTTLAEITLPILPNLDWFFEALTTTIVSITIGLKINKEHQEKVVREKGKKKKQNIGMIVAEVILVIIFALFVAGIFKYQPVAVLTNSMKPVFERGDVVIVQKMTEKEKKKIKINDVIQYQANNYIIIHRVIKIEKDKNGNLLFTTKGDFNKEPDSKKVKEEQIIGTAKFYIPKIGYPSVWLNEFFNK